MVEILAAHFDQARPAEARKRATATAAAMIGAVQEISFPILNYSRRRTLCHFFATFLFRSDPQRFLMTRNRPNLAAFAMSSRTRNAFFNRLEK